MTGRIDNKWIVRGVILLALFLLQVASLHAGEGVEQVSFQDNYAAAIEHWTYVLPHAKGAEEIKTLLRRGEAYRGLGHFTKAQSDFTAALEKAKSMKHPLLEVVAAQSLGYIYLLEQNPAMAEPLLTSAFEKAKSLDQNALAASCANRLGTLLYNQGKPEKARERYLEALAFSKKANDPALGATIYRNLARVAQTDDLAMAHLVAARQLAMEVTSPVEQASLLVGIATEAGAKAPHDQHMGFRYEVLQKALSLAGDSSRLTSFAAGEMGKLYEIQGRFQEALSLTEQALKAAQALGANELLLQWEWQQGRLLRGLGQRNKAISAYWRAVYYIQTIRQDVPEVTGEGCTSFRETLSPIYLDLADMLLVQSGEEEDPATRQNLLRQAQQAVESVKQSQLRDYFKDPCIDALSRPIESLSPGTAVIYPIILPHRLELLADIGGNLYRRTTPIEQQELEQNITQLAGNLRNFSFHKKLSRQVYTQLITPLESLLDQQKVDTLVFVPDGVFRMLPLAALYDGEKFLVEKYAVATEPGLSLLDPKPLPRGDMKALLAGMSKPGPVVLDLPSKLWDALCRMDPNQMERGVRGVSLRAREMDNADSPPATVDASAPLAPKSAVAAAGEKITDGAPMSDVERVKRLLALPGVDKEIESLSHSLPNQTLMNSSFLLGDFSRHLKEQDYRIVHIASHGYFGGSPKENFIMTYDKCLNMNHLEADIKPKQLAEQPVELITLSACQTAEGDDRSPLGLAGVALKSGARSVMGSLWPVSDTATQQLLSDFYLNLKDPEISKAEALRLAQVKRIKTDGFEHPFYWSAFILVGNWL